MFELSRYIGDENENTLWISLILIATSLFLSGCGPEISVTVTPIPPIIETPVLINPQLPSFPTETPSALSQYMIPPYYPESYVLIVNGSKSEGRDVDNLPEHDRI